MVKAADMLIARRADTRARADFATWKMMAKLNGSSALPAEAQEFLVSYKNLLARMSEGEATEATIGAIYKAYYAEMGGAGTPPDVRTRPPEPAADNVTAFRRPPPKPKTAASFVAATFGGAQKRPLPVALIFACLVVVYVGIRLYWR
ncbi:hypothetical protein ABIF64_005284 [Bradyrhizobium japonicum]|uniref:Uncharacterized protein n=2 Tax=Nitrobacteraceae TaxID=41294 RepID=A0ABV2S055_BRAJP|nr:hypothetical protein [Bradyrhizobium japonicum]BAL11184.1 hypothetical protein BJ6T_59290 [Bradyrhizobium japonicum USDA 6]MCP1789048.1 hypothetical protein [Bradyrhizobium japonicum]MCP1801547.1 hypothetical protein [Bradyrhizobium japonicum]MCP1819856.1 hypothetical protein [Bradyrhizobium japonicum]